MIFGTTETDGKVVEPTSTLGSIHEVSGEVISLVVIQQTQNGECEGPQSDVPAIIMTLARGFIN